MFAHKKKACYKFIYKKAEILKWKAELAQAMQKSNQQSVDVANVRNGNLQPTDTTDNTSARDVVPAAIDVTEEMIPRQRKIARYGASSRANATLEEEGYECIDLMRRSRNQRARELKEEIRLFKLALRTKVP